MKIRQQDLVGGEDKQELHLPAAFVRNEKSGFPHKIVEEIGNVRNWLSDILDDFRELMI